MEIKHVAGKNKGKLLLFALSTCAWCKKAKKMLTSLGVGFDYCDVDRLDKESRQAAEKELKKWNPHSTFPTLVLDNKKCIIGFSEEEIAAELSK